MNASAARSIPTINGFEGEPSTKPYDLALSHEFVKELFSYDAKSGLLIWRERPLRHFETADEQRAWNKRCAGKSITCRDDNGYVRVWIKGVNRRLWLVHRVIWLWNYGYLPKLQIDHIDHDRSNNRLENLRLVTQSGNNCNRSLCTRNMTGVIGVTWHTRSKRWRATIYLNKKHIELGKYKEFEQAVLARKVAEKVLGFHKNHGRAV